MQKNTHGLNFLSFSLEMHNCTNALGWECGHRPQSGTDKGQYLHHSLLFKYAVVSQEAGNRAYCARHHYCDVGPIYVQQTSAGHPFYFTYHLFSFTIKCNVDSLVVDGRVVKVSKITDAFLMTMQAAPAHQIIPYLALSL